jgi:hypothetical protein
MSRKYFSFHEPVTRKDDTEVTANTIIDVPDPAIRAYANGCLKLIHDIIKHKRDELLNTRSNQQQVDPEATPVTSTLTTKDGPDLETNVQNKPASRSKSLAQRQLKPGSRLPPLDGAKFMEDLLLKTLDRQKKKRKKVKGLPQDLTHSGEFPQPLAEIDQRMTAARDMLHHLNKLERNDVNNKVQIIKQSVKEIVSPVLEHQRLQNIKRDKERMTEGFLSSLGKGLLTYGALSVAQKGFGIDPKLVAAVGAAFKKPKAKPLRSIVKVASDHPKPSSGVSVIGSDEPRTNAGMQLRQVPQGSVLSKNSRGGSTWSKKIMS